MHRSATAPVSQTFRPDEWDSGRPDEWDSGYRCQIRSGAPRSRPVGLGSPMGDLSLSTQTEAQFPEAQFKEWAWRP